MYTAPPFVAAANTPLLHSAFDQLVGRDRWMPCRAMGTFPVRFPATEDLATGEAGTVYLCHPFLVHAGQRHRGTRPKFMAQPPLLPRVELDLRRPDASPVERAIQSALRGHSSA